MSATQVVIMRDETGKARGFFPAPTAEETTILEQFEREFFYPTKESIERAKRWEAERIATQHDRLCYVNLNGDEKKLLISATLNTKTNVMYKNDHYTKTDEVYPTGSYVFKRFMTKGDI